MHFAPKLAHLSASCFREPVIDAGKNTEERYRHDEVMEIIDDVVGIVQIKIGRIKRQRNARKTANSKHRQKSNREKHRHIEANGAAPKRNEKRAQDDH